MKIVFFGSDHFSRIIVAACRGTSHTIQAIVTTPDTKKGRGQQESEALLKMYAREHALTFFQPDDLKDPRILSSLNDLGADIFLVVSYGKILPHDMLVLPRLYCINIHPSLLPKYRGPSPVPYTLLYGDTKTGFTVITLNEKVDSGDILYQEAMSIDTMINAYELTLRIARSAGEKIGAILDMIDEGTVSREPQDERKASYVPLLKKQDGLLDWNTRTEQLHNTIRALVPWPSAYTSFNNKMLKIYQSSPVENIHARQTAQPGTIVEINKDGWLTVKTQDGYLRIHDVHYAGKKRMSAYEWVQGQRLKEGDTIG